jgi:hypothetical protein
MPCRVDTGPKKVLLKATTPRVLECPVAKVRAAVLRRYPSPSAAASTRARVIGLTLACWLSARETVWGETPASLATSVMAGGRRADLELREVTSGNEAVSRPAAAP